MRRLHYNRLIVLNILGETMPLTYITGDPLMTEAQTLAFGCNARARTELGTLDVRLFDQFPAAFATYRKQCAQGRLKPGDLWLWRESRPSLLFMVIRETSVGATRPRFVESAVMTIARDYHLYGLKSLSIAPLGDTLEWPALKPILDYWLKACPLPITVYDGS